MQHFGTECRSSDAEMDDLRKIAQHTGFDYFDQTFHALVQHGGIVDARRVSGSALGAMFRRPSLAYIDRFAAQQGIHSTREVQFVGQFIESVDSGCIEMGF